MPFPGMAHETEVPFVAWGAGVRRPEDPREERKKRCHFSEK